MEQQTLAGAAGWRGDADELRVRIQQALRNTIDDAWDCTRVWSAWGYGTMREDDFIPLMDRMEEIIDEIAEQVSAPITQPGDTA